MESPIEKPTTDSKCGNCYKTNYNIKSVISIFVLKCFLISASSSKHTLYPHPFASKYQKIFRNKFHYKLLKINDKHMHKKNEKTIAFA